MSYATAFLAPLKWCLLPREYRSWLRCVRHSRWSWSWKSSCWGSPRNMSVSFQFRAHACMRANETRHHHQCWRNFWEIFTNQKNVQRCSAWIRPTSFMRLVFVKVREMRSADQPDWCASERMSAVCSSLQFVYSIPLLRRWRAIWVDRREVVILSVGWWKVSGSGDSVSVSEYLVVEAEYE